MYSQWKWTFAKAEFYRKERERSTTRDAKHVMPIRQIPDLNWKFDENINQVTSKIPEMGKHGAHLPHMPKIPGSTPEEKEMRIEVLKETIPEETCSIKTPQMKEEINAGIYPNNKIKGTEQAEVIEQATDPVKVVEPVKTTEPVEAVEPVQATKPVPTASETACTTVVSHVEEEKQEEHTPQSPPRSPGSSQVNSSIVNKFCSAFRPTIEENPQAAP